MTNKIYTAQEMRDAADFFVRNAEMVRQKVISNMILANIHDLIPMLRHSAEVVEENAKLKARLEAVEKECEKRMKEYDCGACDFTDEPPWTFEQCEIKGCPTRLHAMEFLSILRVACGEGGAK